MRYFLVTIFSALGCFIQSSAQPCGAGTISCPNEKIISPSVTKPINAGIASATCSTLVIKWTGAANQQYEVKATYQNAVTNATETIAATNISCDADNNCTATIPVTAGIKYTWSVEARGIVNNCPQWSYPVISVMDYPVQACNGAVVTLGGKVFLQGAYNAVTGTMFNDLNSLGILQSHAAIQPYNTTAFLYNGTESVGAGFFAAHPDIVDWVLVELRNPNLASAIVARKAAFVRQDGTIVDTSGANTQLSFEGIAPGHYYVSVKHRNHLSIRSTTPVDFSSGLAAYDFTTANYKSFQNQWYTSPVQMGTVWVMRGGNANVNANTKYSGPGNDQNQVLNIRLGGSLSLILNNVYAPEDVNMNGNIKWSGPGSDQNFLLNIVLAGSLSTILQEQF